MPHNLEITALQIKTDRAAESRAQLTVSFYTADRENAGEFWLYFVSPLKYRISSCTDWTDLPYTLPSEVTKVLQITKLQGPRLQLQCNGVTLLDIVMSDDTCSISSWSKVWTKQIKQIRFPSYDSASDKYRAVTPGNYNYIIDN